jgi:hypothetical protein
MMAVQCGLWVVRLRVEFYDRFAKNPMHDRLVMPVLEVQNDTPAKDNLGTVMKKLDTHIATQPMIASASLHTSNSVKRSGDGETASQ